MSLEQDAFDAVMCVPPEYRQAFGLGLLSGLVRHHTDLQDIRDIERGISRATETRTPDE